MESKDSIKRELINIGYQHGYKGETLELAADLVAYAVYHNQIEVMNAVQESSLSTAKLMNSKIKECMEVMYSVYRGNNARVILNFTANTQINVDKFECVYESNTFKLYAAEAYNIAPYVEGSAVDKVVQMECIFCTKSKYVYEVDITKDNRYHIDVLDQYGHPLSNISEEVRVFIDDVEYPVTRDFHEHINCPIASNINDRDNLDKIFVLTTPDYGIMLFKRGYYGVDENGNNIIYGYFPIGSKVRVECMQYTKGLASDSRLMDGDINPDEFNKILLPGTVLVPFNPTEYNGEYADTGRKPVDEIEREDGNSLLYNANSASRTQSQILSNSDVCHLFSEYFIKYIKSASMRYDVISNPSQGNGVLMIFYVPRIDGFILTKAQLDEFREKYKSYFIATDIQALPGQLVEVDVNIEIYINDTNELSDEINSIFSEYTNILTQRSNLLASEIDPERMDYDFYSELINKKIVQSQINKIDTVKYIENLYYSYAKYYLHSESDLENPEELPTSYETTYVDSDGITRTTRVPIYYRFTPIVAYKNAYESIS